MNILSSGWSVCARVRARRDHCGARMCTLHRIGGCCYLLQPSFNRQTCAKGSVLLLVQLSFGSVRFGRSDLLC